MRQISMAQNPRVYENRSKSEGVTFDFDILIDLSRIEEAV